MLNIRTLFLIVALALLAPAFAATTSARQDAGTIDFLDMGDFGGGSNPQEIYNPFAPSNLGGVTPWLWEPLMVVSQFTCELSPWLATEFAWPDELTLNLTIRDGVQWSDGTPFSAEDVVFYFNLIKQYPAFDTDALWNFLTEVTATGNVVSFKFSEPTGSLFNKIVNKNILPKHVWEAVEDPLTFENTDPVGTGPFMVERFSPRELTMVRNPNYWQAEKVLVQELHFTKIEGDQQIEQLTLAEGGMDWATIFMPDVENTFVAKDPENNHYWFNPGGSVSLMFNHTLEPYNDPEFRRAVAYAVDRQSMSERAAFGYTPPASQAFVTIPGQEVYLDPAIPNQGVVPYDPAEAGRILDAAGYALDGDTRLGKDGEPLELTFTVQRGWNDWQQAAEILRDNLQAIGIQVEIEANDPELVGESREIGEFEMAFDAPGGGCNVFDGYFYPLGGSDAPKPVGETAEWNWMRWNDPETHALIQQLKSATTIEQQQPIVYQLQQIMINELPFIPLWYGPVWFEYQTDKAVGWPTQENPYAGPGNQLVIMTNLTPAPAS